METGNRNSGLEERLEGWRSQISGGDLNTDEVDELESHLEDSIDEYINKGLSEEDAWMLAIHRMGSCEAIKKEFKKVKDSRVPLLNQILYWAIVLFIIQGVLELGVEMFENLSRTGSVRQSRVIMLVILLITVSWIVYIRREVKKTFGIVLFTAIPVFFFTLFFGFLTSFESPVCRNSNPVFENNSPQSEVYKRELLKLFARLGTDNLYYLYKVYFSKNGQDYIMVKVVGKDFCAEFPVNFTHSQRWRFLKETVGNDHYDCELQGLKFDVVTDTSGTEFVFKELSRIAD